MIHERITSNSTGNVDKRFTVLTIGFIILTTCALTGCIGSNAGTDNDTILLYGFSVKGEVFDDKIIPAFRSYWKDKCGKDIKFKTTYAGSGKITNQVISGAPAEVMILSTEWDALQLKKEKLVTTDWKTFPQNGTVSKSPWIILTRSGNPEAINDFPNLTAEDIEIIHADPLTSGGACWSIFSIYGSMLKKTEINEGAPNRTAAIDLLEGIVDNVISWQSSARKALSQFSLGYGDTIITYENEALLTISQGKNYEIVYPRSTIYSEHKVVIVDKNVNNKEREVIEEFIDFLYTSKVQGYLADYGFRSVYDEINSLHSEFPSIELPFTVEYLGGWEEARPEIIDGIFKDIKK